MKLKYIIPIWLAVGLFSIACRRTAPVSTTEAEPGVKLNWLANFEVAKAQAHAESKTLLILFTGSDWCPPCMLLHRQVFTQLEFAEYAAKNLVLLEVDFPHTKAQSDEQKAANEKLADQFGIYGFPAVVVLDASGKKIGELGYMPGGPKPFIAALENLPGTGAANEPPK